MELISILATLNAVLLAATAWLLLNRREPPDETLGAALDLAAVAELSATEIRNLMRESKGLRAELLTMNRRCRELGSEDPRDRLIAAARAAAAAGADADDIQERFALTAAESGLMLRCQNLKVRQDRPTSDEEVTMPET